jgi:methyl-accepting chemotaxis protein
MTSCDERLLAAITALKNGDLTVRLPEEEAGTAGEIALTFNAFLDQMNAIVSEFNRLSREMGTEGRFGGQAQVSGLDGTWANLTTNVNGMAESLTEQIRGMGLIVELMVNSGRVRPLSPHQDNNEIRHLRNSLTELAHKISEQV